MKKIQKFSKREAFKFGWETLKKNFGILVLIFVVFLAISFIPDIAGRKVMEFNSLSGTALYIFGYFLTVVVSIGLVKISLKFYNNEEVKIGDLFSCVHLFWKYLGASILYGIIVVAGLFLFIIPGIIFSLKFYFFDYFIVDKNCGPVEALKRSAGITAGNKWNLFLFVLMLIAINILGALLAFIGLIVTVPISILATVYVYKKLAEPEESFQEQANQ